MMLQAANGKDMRLFCRQTQVTELHKNVTVFEKGRPMSQEPNSSSEGVFGPDYCLQLSKSMEPFVALNRKRSENVRIALY